MTDNLYIYCIIFKKEKYCYIRDRIIFYQIVDDLYVTCASCKGRTHYIHECPLMHYTPNKMILLTKLNFSQFQNRDINYGRRIHKNTNHSLKNNRKNKKSVYNARFDKSIMTVFHKSSIDNLTKMEIEDTVINVK